MRVTLAMEFARSKTLFRPLSNRRRSGCLSARQHRSQVLLIPTSLTPKRKGDRRSQKTHSREIGFGPRRQTRGARARTRRRRSRAIYGISLGPRLSRSRACMCVRNRGDMRRPRCGFTGAGRRELHQRVRRVRAVRLVVHDDSDNDEDTTREIAPRRDTRFAW